MPKFNLLLAKCRSGDGYTIQIEGDSAEIIRFYTYLCNYGWTETKIDWITKTLGTLYISRKHFPKLGIPMGNYTAGVGPRIYAPKYLYIDPKIRPIPPPYYPEYQLKNPEPLDKIVAKLNKL